jgi:hypothetical protein
MKVYSFVRNDRGECVLYIEDGDRRHAVPLVIPAEPGYMSRGPLQSVAMAMLTDWMGDEDNAGLKAASLTRVVANRLSRRGREWAISDRELGSIVANLMCTAYEEVHHDAAACVIEIVSAERRDVLRQSLSSYASGVC